MDAAAAAVISALTSIGVALVGVWVARKKGLPLINAEIESRNGELIDLLKDQVDALEGKLEAQGADFAQCKGKLTRALEENVDLRSRVTLAEGDLVRLYRETGTRPPARLSEGQP